MIEHPNEPHMHCPVCLAPIMGAEDAPESGVNATAHFKAEHPALYEQISERAKEYVLRSKSRLN